MNHPRHTHTRCTFCGYRHAAGALTINDGKPTHTEPCCLSCAEEALLHHALRPGTSALFAATELCC